MLQHLSDFGLMNQIYAQMFKGHKPARICVEVAKLPANALVEIDLIAIKQ